MDISQKAIQNLKLDKKKVFVRVDFNVPLKDGEVAEDQRIVRSFRTIDYILDKGGMPILASHFKRPAGTGYEADKSLKPVLRYLKDKYPGILFSDSCIGDEAIRMSESMKDGDILLLENLRFYKGEEKNDPEFSQKLAGLADVYVNDAFGSSHRAHASIYGITQYIKEKAFGFLMQDEINNLSKLLSNPESPYVAVMGGAKLSSKLAVLENLLKKVDKCLLGGGISYPFLKVQGFRIGQSLNEDETLDACRHYLELYGDRIVLPVDRWCGNTFENGTEKRLFKLNIPDDMIGMDIGPDTVELFKNHIRRAETIFLNGPMGVFEFENFSEGTVDIARATGDSGAFSVVGGGESVQAIRLAGMEDCIDYVSTGGGASLEFLGGVVLPGVQAIME